MYKAVRFFTDLQDNNFAYNVGDVFPHAGKEVTQERLDELASTNNKRGKVMIEKVEDEPTEEIPAEEIPTEEIPTEEVPAEEVPAEPAPDFMNPPEEVAEDAEPEQPKKKRGRPRNA